jgi:hypothetical protein
VTASSQKIGRRTEPSQGIGLELEASDAGLSGQLEFERSEDSASDVGWQVKREPDHSEGSPAPPQDFGHARVLTEDRTLNLGTHKRSRPDLKHLTTLAMLSPDLSVVRVQHFTRLQMFNANPTEVRVRPHKRSDAELEALHVG